MNSTTRYQVTNTNETDIAVCIGGIYWTNQVLSPISSTCDIRFADFYKKNILLSRTTAEEFDFLYKCQERRHQTLGAARTYDFIPPDLLDDWRNIPAFAETMFYGYTIYNQYRNDRLMPTKTILSSAYQNNYRVSGFSVSHLESLANAPEAVIHEALMTDDPNSELSMLDYAKRAETLEVIAPSPIWALHTSGHTASVMRFWNDVMGAPQDQIQPLQKRTIADGKLGLIGQFIDFAITRMAKQQPLPVPSVNWSAVGDPNSPTSGQLLHLGSQALIHDVPLHVIKIIDHARKDGLFGKGMVAGQTLFQVAYAGVLATVGVASDLIHSTRTAENITQTPFASAIRATARSIWKPRPVNESLAAIGGRFVSSISDIASRTMGIASGKGPAALYSTFLKISDLATTAQFRRNRLYRLAQLISSTFVRAYANEADYEELGVLPILESDFNQSSGLPCRSPYPEICAQCLYLDQGLGAIIGGSNQSFSYYGGDGAQEPSYNYSQGRYEYLEAYLNDPLAPVEIGSATYLPIRYPWNNYSNFMIVGDSTENKLRFDDLADIFDEFLEFLFGPTTGGGGSGGDVFTLAHDSISSIVHAPIWSGINKMFASFVSDVVGAPTARDAAGNFVVISATGIVTILQEIFNYFYSWIKTCSYREELNGSMKRFSIGEAILIMIGVAAGMGLILGGIFPGQILTVLGGLGTILGMAILFGTLIVSYSWSYSCTPALPYQLADDLMYFITHTLFTRCDWMVSGIIQNDTYTNDQVQLMLHLFFLFF